MFQKIAKAWQPFLSNVVLLACLLVMGTTNFAQDPPSVNQDPNPAITSRDNAPIGDRLQEKLSVFNFDGGTIDEYIEALKETLNSTGRPSFNIVIAENARRQRMPMVALENVTLKSMLNLIQELCVDNNESSLVTVEFPDEYDREYVAIKSNGPGPETIVRVFSIAKLKSLNPQPTEETLLKALNAVLEMNESTNVQIQLHNDANLLIAKGTFAELELIQQTIIQMSAGLNTNQSLGGGGQGGGGYGGGGLGGEAAGGDGGGR